MISSCGKTWTQTAKIEETTDQTDNAAEKVVESMIFLVKMIVRFHVSHIMTGNMRKK